MTTIATHRVFDSGAVLLWGRMGVIDTNGHIEHSEFANPSEMAAFYSKKLLLPRFPVRRAIEILRDLNGIEIFVSK